MTLQSTEGISLGNVVTELGRAEATTTSLGEAAVRNLAGVVSGQFSLRPLTRFSATFLASPNSIEVFSLK